MTTVQRLPHAGVHFPPPFIYLGGLVAGWLLHRRWPLPISVDGFGPRESAAALALAVWLVFMLGAFATFRRAGTTVLPNRPASALATSGVFRITRNPMYVSLVGLYLGVTLAVNTWWPMALLPLVVAAIDRFVIAREERYLATRFPEEYADYCRRVRRWL